MSEAAPGNEGWPKVSFTVSPDVATRIRTMAESRGVGVGELIRMALVTMALIDNVYLEGGTMYMQLPGDSEIVPFDPDPRAN